MAPTRSQIKRESTVAGDYPTPAESSSSGASPAPKRERVESIDLTGDNIEVPPTSHNFISNHGLPARVDTRGESYQPESVPMRGSRPPPVSKMSTENPTQGLQVVARDVNRLVDLIDKLRRVGLKDVGDVLPELVLCGDQSAGKSSLMGAIAEINLPKGQSMCTKCPTNIKTNYADEWSCTVSLQLEYNFNVRSQRGDFPNWVDNPHPSSFTFKTIDDKSELEEVLMWAQIALLNPSTDYESFIPGTEEQLRRKERDQDTEARFSPNVVSVEIRGPGLPALSFYDLPGLFHAAENNQQQFLVKVFKKLTKKYIEHPNAIVICAITMANDPGLSATKALISESKVDHKCIGVLTMPDRLQGDATEKTHKDYDSILRQEKWVLPRGYFVTKQPGPDSPLNTGGALRSNYHALARREEEAFFNNSPIWSDPSLRGGWSQFRDRCGTETIQKYLSKEFANQVFRSIPDLTGKIDQLTREVDNALADLPEIPSNEAQYTVRRSLRKFSEEVRNVLDGNSVNHSHKFHSTWTKLCGQFLKSIDVMEPTCVLGHPSDDLRDVISIDDSDAESMSQPPRTPAKRNREESETPNDNKRVRVQGTPPIPVSLPHTPGRVKQENGMMHPPFARKVRMLSNDEIGPFRNPKWICLNVRALNIGTIRQAIEHNSRAGVPGYVSYKVREDYALKAIAPWHHPLQTFVDRTFQMLRQQVFLALEDVLRQHVHTSLYRQSRAFVEEFLRKHEDDQRAMSVEFFNIEKPKLFTINNEAFNRYKGEALATMATQRRKLRVEKYAEKHHRSGRTDIEKFKEGVTDELLGRDPFEQELELAAYVRGYYTTAKFRFVDSVCANMHTKYFHNIAEGLRDFLEEKFMLDYGNSDEKCAELLEGNAELSQQRSHLKAKKAQLDQFTRTLDDLRKEFSDDSQCQSQASSNGIDVEMHTVEEDRSDTVM